MGMKFVRLAFQQLPPTLRLAIPISAGHVGQMLMGVADTIMVGHVGTLALAACAFANNVFIAVAVTGFGVLTAVSVRVSHAHGSGCASAMARAFHAGWGLSVAGGVAAALLMHAFYPLLHFLGQEPDVVEEARSYFLIIGWSLIPAWVGSSARNYLDAQSHPWPSFWIMLGGVILNVLLNWLLIFGGFGLPALGLFGAGLATLLSRVATAAAILAFIYAGRWRPCEPLRFGSAWWSEQRAVLRLGIPAGLQLLCEASAFSAAGMLVGLLGSVSLAAHQIAMSCASTTFMFPLGIATAATVRIAQASGAGRRDLLRPIAAGAWGGGIVTMMVFAVLFLFASGPIAAIFTRDPEVVGLAASLLVIAGVFQLADGVQVVGSGLLRGLRDTRGPMLITIAAYWLVALPLGAWLALGVGTGARGIWFGLALGLAVASALLVRRFVRRTA